MTQKTEDVSSTQTVESMIKPLVTDVTASIARLEEEDSESNRRELIRTVFAGIEDAHWIAKKGLLNLAPHITHLSIHETAALKEESYTVSESGAVRVQPKFIPIRTSVKQLVGILARIKADYSLDLNHPAWKQLQNASKARNRITHPKRREDLRVAVEEVQDVIGAFNWMLAFTIEALEIVNGAARNLLGERQRQIESRKPAA